MCANQELYGNTKKNIEKLAKGISYFINFRSLET